MAFNGDFFKEQLPFLRQAAIDMGVELDKGALALFRLYAQRMVEANRSVNLTAVTEPQEMAVKHFLDSISPVAHNLISPVARVVDVGCGAGMPGLPLKFALPGLRLTLLDSLNKRIRFIEGFLTESGLAEVRTVAARAEEAARLPDYREGFDAAVSRAVAGLGALCEYCLPFVRVGGLMIAYKGRSAPEEAKAAARAAKTLGGGSPRLFPVMLDGGSIEHYLVVIDKLSPTPPAYPRRQAKILKSPLY